MFRRKKHIVEDPVEQRFDSMMELIKDLPRADYNRLKDAKHDARIEGWIMHGKHGCCCSQECYLDYKRMEAGNEGF